MTEPFKYEDRGYCLEITKRSLGNSSEFCIYVEDYEGESAAISIPVETARELASWILETMGESIHSDYMKGMEEIEEGKEK